MNYLNKFEIAYDNDQTDYYPGDLIRGYVVLQLSKETTIENITIQVEGDVQVIWTVKRGKKLVQEFASYKELLYDLKVILDDPTGEVVLNKGHHQVPFVLQLPIDGISSSFDGQFGRIKYWITAKVTKPWLNRSISRPFKVTGILDLNSSGHLYEPVSNDARGYCLFPYGKLLISARLERRGYCPGEVIKVNATFVNGSNFALKPKITLYQRQCFYATKTTAVFNTDAEKKVIDRKVIKMDCEAIPSNQTVTWADRSFQLPAIMPSLLNNMYIQVDYFLRLRTVSPLFGSNLFIDMPIVLGHRLK